LRDVLRRAGGATSSGGLVLLPASGGDDWLPPFSASAAMPVKPWNSRPTWVSGRTATNLSIEMVAVTCCGRSGLSLRSVTSPTRMPLNSTEAPVRKPDTEPSNCTR